jgi:hypothetical protein
MLRINGGRLWESLTEAYKGAFLCCVMVFYGLAMIAVIFGFPIWLSYLFEHPIWTIGIALAYIPGALLAACVFAGPLSVIMLLLNWHPMRQQNTHDSEVRRESRKYLRAALEKDPFFARDHSDYSSM